MNFTASVHWYNYMIWSHLNTISIIEQNTRCGAGRTHEILSAVEGPAEQMTKLNPGSQSAPSFSLYLRIFVFFCLYLCNCDFDYYSFRLQPKEQSRPSWPTSIQEVHQVLPSDTSQVHLRSLCFVFPYLYILDCYFWVFVQLFCAAPDYFDCRKSICSSTQTPQKSIYAALFIFFLDFKDSHTSLSGIGRPLQRRAINIQLVPQRSFSVFLVLYIFILYNTEIFFFQISFSFYLLLRILLPSRETKWH